MQQTVRLRITRDGNGADDPFRGGIEDVEAHPAAQVSPRPVARNCVGGIRHEPTSGASTPLER